MCMCITVLLFLTVYNLRQTYDEILESMPFEPASRITEAGQPRIVITKHINLLYPLVCIAILLLTSFK
jgi:hypothetical protein